MNALILEKFFLINQLNLFKGTFVFLWLIIVILINSCIIRLDWDRAGKPPRVYTYEHPHDGNLTRAEIARSGGEQPNGGGMYRIKTEEELNGRPVHNCVSKTAKCLSDCNRNYDVFSTIFAPSVAIMHAKRASCYDECYNEITPGCSYPLKRIQY